MTTHRSRISRACRISSSVQTGKKIKWVRNCPEAGTVFFRNSAANFGRQPPAVRTIFGPETPGRDFSRRSKRPAALLLSISLPFCFPRHGRPHQRLPNFFFLVCPAERQRLRLRCASLDRLSINFSSSRPHSDLTWNWPRYLLRSSHSIGSPPNRPLQPAQILYRQHRSRC